MELNQLKMENNVWMPHKEWLLMKGMMDAMSPIQRMRQAYFFWNNFSEEGFDEYLASLILKSEEEKKPLVVIKKRGRYGK